MAMIVHSVTETDKTLPWAKRKAQALEHIPAFSHESLLVKSADVIANYTELIDDHARNGDAIFMHFAAPKEVLISQKIIHLLNIPIIRIFKVMYWFLDLMLVIK